jgi:glutamate 5-kinase
MVVVLSMFCPILFYQRLKTLVTVDYQKYAMMMMMMMMMHHVLKANLGYTEDGIFSDNDSLAALCARNFDAEVLVMLTDVEGVFDRSPSISGAKMLDLYMQESSNVSIGAKSGQGTVNFAF